MDLRIALTHRLSRHACQLRHLDKPLQAQARLNRLTGALRVANRVHVRAHLLHNAPLLRQRLAHRHAGLFAAHAIKLGASVRNAALLIHDDRHIQIVAQTHLIVIRVMRRRDLHRAGTQLTVHVIISDHLQLQVIAERVIKLLANQMGVALILRVNRNSNIPQHRLHTSGCNHQVRLIIIERAVADGDKLTLNVLVHHLNVRHRSL